MVKYVHFKVNSFHPDALVILGWIVFAVGVYVSEPMWLKFSLLSATGSCPEPSTLSPTKKLSRC